MQLGKILSMIRPHKRGGKRCGAKSLFVIVRKDGMPVRYGMNGAGGLGFCMYLGQIAAFVSFDAAQSIVGGFEHPDDYKVVRYDEAEV